MKNLLKSFKNSLERVFEERRCELIHKATRRLSFRDVKEDDVFIVAFPKSGTTWFQSIAAGIMYHIDVEKAPGSLIQEVVPEVKDRGFYKRYQNPMVMRWHTLPIKKIRKAVYLIRDGRDAMVSYFHFEETMQRRNLDFYEFVKNLKPKWHEHVEAWKENPFSAEILEIKYEDLKSNPQQQIERFCEFVGIKRDTSQIREVIRATAFQAMRKKEVRMGWGDENGEIWGKDRFFTRRGVVGSYKDEMPVEVLDLFLSQAKSTLLKCHYTL